MSRQVPLENSKNSLIQAYCKMKNSKLITGILTSNNKVPNMLLTWTNSAMTKILLCHRSAMLTHQFQLIIIFSITFSTTCQIIYRHHQKVSPTALYRRISKSWDQRNMSKNNLNQGRSQSRRVAVSKRTCFWSNSNSLAKSIQAGMPFQKAKIGLTLL